MPAIPANSPIQRLDFNLFYCIVEMNANMFDDDRALEITLATSRVCRDWRISILGMPSIWAHLIDLDCLHWRTVEFRREMIRRSGTSFLWMKAHGCVGHHRTDPIRCVKYVLNMIGENWGQTQRLGANIAIEHVDPIQWGLLNLPAPHLESLKLNFALPNDIVERPFLSLFGGSAPMVREFRFSGHASNLIASWLYQLHTLALDARQTVSEALGVLVLAKNLVNLRLCGLVVGDTTSPLPHFALPKLVHLLMHINIDLKAGTVLLDHIHIPPPCSLNISVHYIAPSNTISRKITLGPIVRSISICAQHYFTHYAPTKLYLYYSSTYFWFEDQTYPDKPEFIFRISIPMSHTFPPQTQAMLLREFALPAFSRVTEFKFDVFQDKAYPIPEIAAFMTCLSSIQVLETNLRGLNHLIPIQRALKTADTGPSIAFPSLKTIKLSSYFDNSSRVISDFITECIADGHAIEILDLRSRPYDVLPDMAGLEEADGLKVLWRRDEGPEILEYICGTDTSRSLLSV